ncbi:hypothetical protein C8J56DRAFT_1087359, partial [Mycena floridula]
KTPKKSTTKAQKSRNLNDLQQTANQKLKEHGKAGRTNTAYDGYMKNMRKFVKTFGAKERAKEANWKEGGERLATEDDDSFDNDDSSSDPEFPLAFDGPPKKCTPNAIATFMALKVFDENCGISTASGVHAAAKRHYKTLSVRLYRGRWNPATCTGNPADSAEVEDMLEACKNKGNEDDRHHSRAMTIRDMEILMAYTEAMMQEAAAKGNMDEVGQWLWFRAFITTGFTLWTRNCETTCLQAKDFQFNAEKHDPHPMPTHIPFFKVNLHHRKNWQNKMKSNGGILDGHIYHIYAQPSTPAICMYTHLLAWIKHYQDYILIGELKPDDYIFPTINGSGKHTYAHTAVSKDIAQKKIKDVTAAAGIRGAERFTTHCFRRGGAQYRFMHAPIGERWTLARIRWWGGWAKNEHRDTLIRYLLDELYNYEETHSDALCPVKHDASTSHNGEGSDSRPLTLADSRVLFQAQAQQIMGCFTSSNYWQRMASKEPNHCGSSGSQLHSSIPVLVASSPFPRYSFAPVPVSAHSSISPPPPPPVQRLVIPNVAKGNDAWRQVVKDWEFADPSRSLMIPLRDWTTEDLRSSKQGQKHNNRRLVATEFIATFHRDEAAFLAAYPEHTKGLEQLMLAIRAECQTQGILKTR